jgi:hypothetical protein
MIALFLPDRCPWLFAELSRKESEQLACMLAAKATPTTVVKAAELLVSADRTKRKEAESLWVKRNQGLATHLSTTSRLSFRVPMRSVCDAVKGTWIMLAEKSDWGWGEVAILYPRQVPGWPSRSMASGCFRLAKWVPAADERPRCMILVDDSFVVVMVVGFGTYEERGNSLAGSLSRSTTDGRRRVSRLTWWSSMRSSFVLVLLSNHMLFLLHTQQLAAAAAASLYPHFLLPTFVPIHLAAAAAVGKRSRRWW